MNIKNYRTDIRKKIRGLKRKSKKMVDNLNYCTKKFPAKDNQDDKYWHLHMPLAKSFIDSKNSPNKVRRLLIKAIIDSTNYLYKNKVKDSNFCKIVSLIELPDLWDSQIIIFFDKDYYDSFFKRDDDTQKWFQIEDKNLFKEHNIEIPKEFKTKGYQEILKDNDEIYNNYLWFVGELE